MDTKGIFDMDKFRKSINSVEKGSFASNLDRREAIKHVQALLARLETPREKSSRLLHVESYLVCAIKCLVNLDLFGMWELSGAQPKTAGEFGLMTGAHPLLLERLLRLLIVTGTLELNEEQKYLFNDFARALASGGLDHFWKMHSWVTANSVRALPEYLQASKYQLPSEAGQSPWSYYMEGQTFFDYMQANPEISHHLNGFMKTKNLEIIPWFTFYPIEDLLEKLDPEQVLVVDMGGGTGKDIDSLRQYIGSPSISGRLILQDLESVLIEANDLDSSIEKLPHDIFTAQPVKGARSYYMHNVLHDWSDEDCQKILTHVKDAMKPGYSRLLINEHILSLESAPITCAWDLAMLSTNAGAERTEENWVQLLEASGLSVRKIHTLAGVDEGLIEAEI